jgi:hypothetical protein
VLQLLHVAEQFGTPRLWALVSVSEPTVARRIVIVGTGHPAPGPDDPFVYVGTFQSLGGEFVWHVFDGGEQQP